MASTAQPRPKPTRQKVDGWKRQKAEKGRKLADALELIKSCLRVSASAATKNTLKVRYTLASGQVRVARYNPAGCTFRVIGEKSSGYALTPEYFLDLFAPGALRPCDLYDVVTGDHLPVGRSAADEHILREEARAVGRELSDHEKAKRTRRRRDEAWGTVPTSQPEERAPDGAPAYLDERGERAQHAGDAAPANDPQPQGTEGDGEGEEGERAERGEEERLVGSRDSGPLADKPPDGAVEADSGVQDAVSESPKRGADAGADQQPRGYMLKRALVRREQAVLVWALLDGVDYDLRVFDNGDDVTTDDVCRPASERFFAHVVVSSAGAMRTDEGWVPVGCRLIEKETGVHRTWAVWWPLYRAGLIEYVPHDADRRLSREFRVVPAVQEAIAEAGPVGTPLQPGEKLYDVFSNTPSNANPVKLYTTDTDEEPIPKLITQALREIAGNGCLFDLDAVAAHVVGLQDTRDRARAGWVEDGAPEDRRAPSQRAYTEALGRWHNDAYCLSAMTNQPLMDKGGGVHRYTPRFARNPQSSGRVTELGGFQNASRGFKAAGLARLRETHDVRNYDVVASHPWGLVQYFERAGVSTEWLRAYLAGDKADYAEQAFGDRSDGAVEVWKRCLLALVTGATVPAHLGGAEQALSGPGRRTSDLPDVAVYLRSAFGGGLPTPEALAALEGFARVVAPFQSDREAWYGVVRAGVKDRTLANDGRGGLYVANAAGRKLNVKGLSDWELTSRVTSHLLQGREAALIHTLTALGPRYGYQPTGNAHDGLVTEGEIPDAAVEEAKEASGFRHARLVEKPYLLPVLETAVDEPT